MNEKGHSQRVETPVRFFDSARLHVPLSTRSFVIEFMGNGGVSISGPYVVVFIGRDCPSGFSASWRVEPVEPPSMLGPCRVRLSRGAWVYCGVHDFEEPRQRRPVPYPNELETPA